MFATLEVSDLQTVLAIIGATLAIIGGVWTIVRGARKSFREAVRDELTDHFREITKPAINEISLKVDKIQTQVELNNGSSLKDAVVRTERKIDKVEQSLARLEAESDQ